MKGGGGAGGGVCVSELVPVCLRDSYVSCVCRCLRRSLVGYPCMCFACLRDRVCVGTLDLWARLRHLCRLKGGCSLGGLV